MGPWRDPCRDVQPARASARLKVRAPPAPAALSLLSAPSDAPAALCLSPAPSDAPAALGLSPAPSDAFVDAMSPRASFPYASTMALKWAQRRAVLLAEIRSYDPDVLCTQECDHYDDYWQPALEAAGYDSLLQRRPANKPDGCAIFYRRARFRLVESMGIQFNEAAGGVAHWTTNNVGLLVRLAERERGSAVGDGGRAGGPRTFVVANHHLYYRQWYSYLRLRQLHLFARKLAEFNGAARDPVIVCGGPSACARNAARRCAMLTGCLREMATDFNTTPDDDMYTLMITGQVAPDAAGRFAVHPDCIVALAHPAPAAAPAGSNPPEPTYAADERVHGPPDDTWAAPPDLYDLFGDLQRGVPGPDGAPGAGLALAEHPTLSAYGRYTELDARHRGHPLWPLEPWCTHYVLHYEGTLDYIHLHDGARAGQRYVDLRKRSSDGGSRHGVYAIDRPWWADPSSCVFCRSPRWLSCRRRRRSRTTTMHPTTSPWARTFSSDRRTLRKRCTRNIVAHTQPWFGPEGSVEAVLAQGAQVDKRLFHRCLGLLVLFHNLPLAAGRDNFLKSTRTAPAPRVCSSVASPVPSPQARRGTLTHIVSVADVLFLVGNAQHWPGRGLLAVDELDLAHHVRLHDASLDFLVHRGGRPSAMVHGNGDRDRHRA